MRALTLTRAVQEAEAVPVKHLTPILVPPDPPRPPGLYRDLDANGMRNPLLVVPMDVDRWAVWVAGHSQARRVVPAILRSGSTGAAGRLRAYRTHVLAVRVGNQRLAWAIDRGYTHVPAVRCEDVVAAEAWKTAHYA